MKKILGLDLGTNSIGWAVVGAEPVKREDGTEYLRPSGIEMAGSRIIPMDASILGNFDAGNSVSQTADRTGYRGTRRLRERFLLRRERLNRVLDVLSFLPEHYSGQLDRYGKFLSNDIEPKLAWKPTEDGKNEFVFMDSFLEMLEDFRLYQPELVKNGRKIPLDWTIYYLRKKALTKQISNQELAWILLNFNQKRGYYQLRGEEEEENSRQKVEYYSLNVVRVEDSGDKKGNDVWYNVYLENGWIYRRSSRYPLDWVGKKKDFIVTTTLDDNGNPKTDKDGNVKRSFRAPKEDDWTLMKKKTEMDIDKSGHTVGEFIYDTLLKNPDQKIKGKLVRTIERKYYKQELRLILKKQMELNKTLQNREIYEHCLDELYSKNEAHKKSIAERDFSYLFVDDIIFYQRPLKSKKSLIDDCPYERYYIGAGKEKSIKCISKSHPLYQEFRLWQFVDNLRIFERTKTVNGRLCSDVDVTAEFLRNDDDYVALFEYLNDRSGINQETLLTKYFNIKKPKAKDSLLPFRWNYVEDKEYPCNETRAAMLAGFKKAGINTDVLDAGLTESLWHILYSISDKQEIVKALRKFSDKHQFSPDFVEIFAKAKPYESSYGAYSAKAISKLLPLMRRGKYWNYNSIDEKTQARIEKIINGEFDESISNRVWEKSADLKVESDFQGLPVWLACYIVYNRHSETSDVVKWNTPQDIDTYLMNFKQHSFRNPIVEQVVLETLRTVRDVWTKVGSIDEIHVELGREMKNPADKRARMSQQNIVNENTNLRIKSLLAEFVNPEYNIENVRPYSPTQQDILRIYEDFALSSLKQDDADYEFIHRMSLTPQPSHSDVLRYKLWLEQKYISPYTGKVIPLARLFTSAYEIEHVIPQSRYFDDSFTNKVICESEINKLKDKQLGYEFIKNHSGEKVQLSTTGQYVEVLSIQAYEEFVRQHYSGPKLKKLLMDDIPDQFIERQMNDSRYISKLIKGLLSNIVREQLENGEYEPEAISKNLIPSNGQITDRLKKDWGVNDVWNSIILPRFVRMNELTGQSCFTATNQEGHIIPAMPLELQKGFNKKRIDHRHHAMDAIVIACTTRDHVNLLNNESALSKNQSNRYALSRKLRRYETIQIVRNGERKFIDVAKEFLMPWNTFTADTRAALNEIVVSFKQNLRIINKATNLYQHYNEKGIKVNVKQTGGDNIAVRKSLHKDTVFGLVNLKLKKQVSINEALKNDDMIVDMGLKERIRKMKNAGWDTKHIKKELEADESISSKIYIYYFTNDTNDRYYATRKFLDTSFDAKTILGAITDTGAQKILLAHLERCDNDPEVAFSPDGIERMNKDIVFLNDGHGHKPIYKVRKYEKADKFAIGQTGNKRTKYVEAAKGTNLFFAIYRTETVNKDTGEIVVGRSFASVPLNVVVERLKQHLTPVPEQNENGDKLLFWLSPNDLVYVPTLDEIESGHLSEPLDKGRIYKMVSCSGPQCFFVQNNIASPIVNKVEFSAMNKMERSISGEMIKEKCVPLDIDRLGLLSHD